MKRQFMPCHPEARRAAAGVSLLLSALCLLSSVFCLPIFAQAAVPEELRTLAVQHDGRFKPFDSFARSVLERVTGAQRVGREDPVATVLSIMAEPDRWMEVPLISVPFGPLREKVGMERKARRVSYNELLATKKLMRMLPPIVEKERRDEKLSMLEQETMDAYERFVALDGLFKQQLDLVPSPAGESWLPILEPAGYPEERQAAFKKSWAALISAAQKKDAEGIGAAARDLTALLEASNSSVYPAKWRLRLEVAYNRVDPVRIAQILYLAAFLGLLIGFTSSKPLPQRIGGAALWAAFLVHVSAIAVRVIIGGRPPVSNFYETTLWLPLVAVALALVFDRIYRVTTFGLAASALAAIALTLAQHLPLDSSISPVVAVLRSNLWLTIHVLTIVASYGAIGLATVLAHVYGGLSLARGGEDPSMVSLEKFLYRAIQVGVVLLAAGIMLGAVWANASWGRYWGWDPKETWALITLLWFLAALHGKHAGWLKGVSLCLATIGGFFLLLVTYYGVSFYLVGLHSYAGGNAKPLPPLLIGYVIAEIVFMAIVAAKTSRRKRLA